MKLYDSVSVCLSIYTRCHTQVVGGDDHAILELRREHRGTGYDRALGMLIWAGGLEVRSIVSAIDIVSGL